MNLSDCINQLKTLDYRTVAACRDFVQWHVYNNELKHVTDETRRGVVRTKRNRLALNWRGIAGGFDHILTRPPQLAATVLNLSASEQTAFIAAADALHELKQPTPNLRRSSTKRNDTITLSVPAGAQDAAERKTIEITRNVEAGEIIARGTWQIKTRTINYRDENGNWVPVRDENGEQKRDDNGRKMWVKYTSYYLYLRVHTRTPDGTKSLASIYIGSYNKKERSGFLSAVEAGRDAERDGTPPPDNAITQKQLIETFAAGGYDAINELKDRYAD